ncbi:hypothetical protein D3C81_514710 [compost metagenome]|uniref:Phosphoribosyl-ATP pyrophosphohydrolase n=1 Tax=Paenibacillus stellifer TaxID=169760 RepID=A0A089LNP3_9BACL|nr:nucleoside triphosphate pyrophosphohydrolase [Paenibacillus stellifer]AIQ62477.1 phosphoribosyl-ATP pyrophosphohydrolase [Paenibacillus stellifer]
MPTYNKLVRDKIPEIIRGSGRDCAFTTLDQESYVVELRKKLREETEEYFQTMNDSDALEELADMLELLYALAEVHKGSPEKLEEVRAKKAEERGGFTEAVFLIEVGE